VPTAVPSRVAEGRRCAGRLPRNSVRLHFDLIHLDLIVELAKLSPSPECREVHLLAGSALVIIRAMIRLDVPPAGGNTNN
jgi:hypothetical protein